MNSISYKSIEYGFRDIVTCEKSNNTRISVMKLKPKVIVIGSTWYITIKYKMKDLICLIVVLLFCFRSNYSTQGGLLSLYINFLKFTLISIKTEGSTPLKILCDQ